ncbi:hypothetical protein MKZ38_001564 [Zalerion maritima]|uniref:mRNA export factor GLE1 n=1 Tax=Zalerion maritima TaxID=339359 RepID=A0AAD5WRF4_9PEZI|nr:hypothetical protein MKZ38_001564 [Zalerion maritima]
MLNPAEFPTSCAGKTSGPSRFSIPLSLVFNLRQRDTTITQEFKFARILHLPTTAATQSSISVMAKNGANSSPSRGSWQLSIPDRAYIACDFVSRAPHSELNHKEALEAAKQHHDRVHEEALRALELYSLEQKQKELAEKRRQVEEKSRVQREILEEQERIRKEELSRIQAAQEAEKARLAAEKRKAEETAKLQELKARKVAAPPAPAPVPAPTPVPASALKPPAAAPSTTSATGASLVNGTKPSPTPQKLALSSASKPPTVGAAASATQVVQPDTIKRVHQNLKKLRKSMDELIMENKRTKQNPQLNQVSDMRRDIGKWVGQLSVGTGGNKKQLNWIMEALNKAKTIPCPLIDPHEYLFEKREPVGQDQPQLPSTFLYLLHIFAKKVVKQFAEECGANTKAADPIGVLAVQIFSRHQFLWRGKSMIDILMAKFYVVCPVVLGIRGNENTPQGRSIVGWRYQGNGFMPEAQHYMRMTGFGAGFAALTLRDFSKSPMKPPLAPSCYWVAFSAIVNTPPNEICSTQLCVLKSMIEGHEHRLLTFWGNMGIAAIRAALIELPRRCPTKDSTVGALQVLGELLFKNTGLPTR